MQISPLFSALLGFLTILQFANGHSWVEQMNVIAPNGTLVGAPGFPRGNSPRGAGFSEGQMVHLVPSGRNNVLATDTLCAPTQQRYEANPISPRLKTTPGSAVALRYQENGHVTQPGIPAGKPKGSGTVFVYMTTSPQENESLMNVHRQWTADGKGGDGRGRLIATANFDDGQCYQINGGPISQQRQQEFKFLPAQPQGANLWCQSDVLLPADLQAGKPVTLYWVWDWPTLPGTPGLEAGKQEIYTTCMDIDIVQDSSSQNGVLNSKSFNFAPQDIGNAAVPAQMKQLGNANAVANPQLIPFSGQAATGSSQGKTSTAVKSAAPSTSTTSAMATADTSAAGSNSQSGANAGSPGSSTTAQGGNPPPVAPVPGPGGVLSTPPGQNQGQGQGRGQGQGQGNGNGRGPNSGSRGGGNNPGTAYSATATLSTLLTSTGVFAPGASTPGAVPEFGTGTGSSIARPGGNGNGNGNGRGPNTDPRPSTPASSNPDNAQGQANADPRPSTPATVTDAPVVTVTKDTFVTETVFVTREAQRRNSSESTPPRNPSTSSESAVATTSLNAAASVLSAALSNSSASAGAAPSTNSTSTAASASASTTAADDKPIVVRPVGKEPSLDKRKTASRPAWSHTRFNSTQTHAHPLNGTHTLNDTRSHIHPSGVTGSTSANSFPVPTDAAKPPCSKAHPVFKLRARAPLFILPSEGDDEC
jgi:hypothetical protein